MSSKFRFNKINSKNRGSIKLNSKKVSSSIIPKKLNFEGNNFVPNLFLKNKLFLFFLGLINIIVGIYSFSFYFNQLSLTPIWLWVFVVDCPLAAILFGLCVLLFLRGTKHRKLFLFSIIANIKFGLWTIFVLIISNSIHSLWWVGLVHLLLVIETIIFLEVFDFRVKDVLLALIVFLVGDFFDYVLLTHPIIPSETILFAGISAVFLTIVVTFFVSIFFSPNKK